MYGARGNVEHVACFHLMLLQHIGDGAVGNALAELRLVDVVGEALIEESAIPHFGLAVFKTQALPHGVVGMHLYREVALCVNELDEQRHLVVVFFCHLLAENLLGCVSNDRDEVAALPMAVADDAGARWHGAHLPRLTHGRVVVGQLLELDQLMTSPHFLVQDGLEQKWIELRIHAFIEI